MKTTTTFFKTIIVLLAFLSFRHANAQIVSSFNFTVNSGGSVSFSSTSVGTNSTSLYTWSFGDTLATSPASNNAQPTHVYANGTYVVHLTVQTGPATNTSVASQTVIVTTGSNSCSLTADFTSSVIAGGIYAFTSISTGTTPGTVYTWDYGDATGNSGILWVAPYHQYTYNGNFIVSLTANNNFTPACVSTKTISLTVTTATCNLIPGFSYINTGNGSAQFISTASAAFAVNTQWDFGDGSSLASGDTVAHTYAVAGTYTVKQILTGGGCQSFSNQQVVITGTACVANSNFTLTPTSTPKFWYAFPSYPYNVTAATWNWGDGTSSNSLYSSHMYSVSATYSICLTVTVSCGDTSTTCSSYLIYKSSGASSEMLGVTVAEPGTVGIKNITLENTGFTVYPNPSNGLLNIQSNTGGIAKIVVSNLMGSVIYSDESELVINQPKEITLNKATSGIYFVKITSGGNTFTQKIIINK